MKAVNVEYSMYLGVPPEVFRKAKELRKNETEAEKILWSRINGNQLLGLSFRRQHPINRFIADFYCHKLKLVIEVDGGIHKIAEKEIYDIGRSEVLNKYGITVIRFENNEIFKNINNVTQAIVKIAQDLLSEAPKSPAPGDLGGETSKA